MIASAAHRVRMQERAQYIAEKERLAKLEHQKWGARHKEQVTEKQIYDIKLGLGATYQPLNQQKIKLLSDEELAKKLMEGEKIGLDGLEKDLNNLKAGRANLGPMQEVALQSQGPCMSSPMDSCWDTSATVAARNNNLNRIYHNNEIENTRRKISELTMLKEEARLRLESMIVSTEYQSSEETQNT